MSKQLRDTIYDALSAVTFIDPHTHINALNPASDTLADILGYHYYTELAHSAGMPKADIEEPGIDPKEKVGRLMENLGPISNTIQYSWFVEAAQALFGFEGEEVNADNWEPLYDTALAKMSSAGWADEVLSKSNLDGVFLTNDFDDPLEGFDTRKYIPCLRTDDLVFHLARPEVRERLAKCTGESPDSVAALDVAIGKLFDHFVRKGAKACAISLPPDFAPQPTSPARAATGLAKLHSDGVNAADSHKRAVANYVFWSLAQRCADYRLPFDLMIGVNRGVYEEGVFQGQDLYDSRVSLIQYKQLFNAFPQVTFPISVLASVTNQELTSYAWIFPNVVTNGHWWYSNTPTYIEHDASARMEAVPRTKQIGYYSDMYKLEFALPKFNMYKRILAKILAERYVVDRGWSETRAIEFGLQILRDNAESIFKVGAMHEEPYIPPAPVADPVIETTPDSSSHGLGLGAVAGAAGAIGLGAAMDMGGLDVDAADDSSDLDMELDVDLPDVPEVPESLDASDMSPEVDFEADTQLSIPVAPSAPAVEPELELAPEAGAEMTLDFEPSDPLEIPDPVTESDTDDVPDAAPSIDPSAATIDLGATVEMDAEEIPAVDFDVDADPDHDTVNDALDIPLAMPPEASELPTIEVPPAIDVPPTPDAPKDNSDPLDLDLDIQLDDPIDPDDFKLDL